MNKTKSIDVLHIFTDPKFSIPLIKFLKQNNFDLDGHAAFHFRWESRDRLSPEIPTYGTRSFFSPIASLAMYSYLRRADRIFIHCLAAPALLFYLALFRKFGEISYWFIWGKDLYFYKQLNQVKFYHRVYELFRKRAIANIKRVVTAHPGDYELLVEWYRYKGDKIDCFSYPSNLFKELAPHTHPNSSIVIMAGNSADPSNNHLRIFDQLKAFRGKDFIIFSFLSYGGPKYANHIAAQGKNLFGEKFNPILHHLELEEYEQMVSQVDIGIFAHERQQAFGAIIMLLGHGKKVYLSKRISTWKTLRELGFVLFDVDDINIDSIEPEAAKNNIELARKVFSKERLVQDWRFLLAGK